MNTIYTNQASEDELTLENLLKFLCGEGSISGRWFGEKYEGEPAFWWRPELKRLIRTEKLKLLAEIEYRNLRIQSLESLEETSKLTCEWELTCEGGDSD